MAEENKLRIRLHLYDTDMAVNVHREDEEDYRNAAKMITDTVNTYSSILKGKKQEKEILYAALLDITLRYVKESKRNDTQPFSDILKKLTTEIEDALK